MNGPSPTPSDLRTRNDGLGQLLRALFPDPRVRLDLDTPLNRTSLTPGWTTVSTYAVVPSSANPRFLIPLGDHRAGAASLLAYNALRPIKVRLARAGLGWATRLGALSFAPLAHLTVSIAADVTATEVVLTEHLAHALGVPVVYAACGVRPVDANYKPTLQLFDGDGRAVGFAKVGWNAATRELVRTEAHALRESPQSVPGHPLVPGLKLALEWGDRVITVVEPLPDKVHGIPSDEPPRISEMLAVARRGRNQGTARRVSESAFVSRLTQAATDPYVCSAVGDRLAHIVDQFVERHRSTKVEFAAWHGDWVPWNLGTYQGRLVAWDWEHSSDDMPIGSDLVHDAFQRALLLNGRPASEAVLVARDHIATSRHELGITPAQCDAVLIGYLVEMWLRTSRLASGGGGWNSALHPHLLDSIERLLATEPASDELGLPTES